MNQSGPGRGARSRWPLALAGLLLLVGAVWSLEQQRLPPLAALELAGGILLWAFAAVSDPPGREDPGSLDPPAPGPRLLPLLLSLGAAAIAWKKSANAVFEPLGVAAWALAVGLWMAAFWQPRPIRSDAGSISPSGLPRARGRLLIGGALFFLVLIGAGFRFYRLTEIPREPNSDHIEDLLNIAQLDRGERPIFFPSNTGQAPLPFYFTFWLHRAANLPLHFLTLKISTALVGVLAIPAVYVLGAEVGGPVLGLLSAALAAWGKWPTLGARRGLTFAWAVFPAALALRDLLRYLRRGDRRSALGAGFWLGLGQYGYNAFKIVPIMVPVTFAFALFDRRRRGRRGQLVVDGLVVAVTALLLFLPLLHYMLQRPDMFWYRALTRAGTRERRLPGPALWVFLGNLKNMALAFHWRGDGAWINTVQGEPFLDVVTGALFIAGLVLALRLAAGGSARWAILILSLFFLTLASTLALAFPIENPGINRAAVAAPSVFILAALPAAYLFGRARERGGLSFAITAGILAALLLFSIQQNFESYFDRFDRQNRILIDPVMEMVGVIREYRGRGVPLENVYLLSTSNWVDARNIAYEIDEVGWSDRHNVAPGAAVPELLDRPLLFVFHPSDAARRDALHRMYPGVDRVIEQPFPDRNFEIYFVP